MTAAILLHIFIYSIQKNLKNKENRKASTFRPETQRNKIHIIFFECLFKQQETKQIEEELPP